MSRRLRTLAWETAPGLVEEFRVEGPAAVVAMYEWLLGRVATVGIAKIIVAFTTDPVRDHCITELADVIKIERHLDPASLERTSGIERRKLFLDRVHDSLIDVARQRGWSEESFQSAYEEVLRRGLEFRQRWKRPTTSPDRQHTAQVEWEFDDEIRLYLLLNEVGSEEDRRVLLVRLPPGMGALEECLGKLQWMDRTTVRLTKANRKDYWSYDANIDRMTFYFDRAERGDPHGQYDLAMMYLQGRGVLRDRERARYWLESAAANGYSKAVRAMQSAEWDSGA